MQVPDPGAAARPGRRPAEGHRDRSGGRPGSSSRWPRSTRTCSPSSTASWAATSAGSTPRATWRGRRRRSKAHAEELAPATEHNPVIVFTLRRGVRFHDGHELDAAGRSASPTRPSWIRATSRRACPDFEPVKTVEPVGEPRGPHRLQAALPARLRDLADGHPAGAPPRTARRCAGRRRHSGATRRSTRSGTRGSAGTRSGSGPFRFREWRTDEYVRLARFDGYWEGPARFEEYLHADPARPAHPGD